MKEIKDIKTIGFIGAGNLGRHAIEKLANEFTIFVSDPSKNQKIIDLGAIYTDLDELVKNAEVIFLSVKPNKVEEVADQLKNILSSQLIISFVAGLKFNNLKSFLGDYKYVLRAMPTLGISSGSSPIAFYTEMNTNDNNALDILEKLGSCLRIEEDKFDAFTSIFGAGPAFISHLSNTLAKIAKEHGFEEPEPWIREILDGTSHIHKSDKKNSFKKIIDMVASKGGVTEAALNKIDEEGIENIWNQAINDAIIKSKALGD